MLVNTILIVLAAIFVVGSVLWSVFLRKLGKTRIRLFTVLGALAVAAAVTVLAKLLFASAEMLLSVAEAYIPEAYLPFISASTTLCNALVGTLGGLLMPVIFLVAFFLADLVSMVIYMIIAGVRGEHIKEKNAEARLAAPRTILLSLAQALIVLMVIVLPISVYTEMAPIVTDALGETEVLPETVQTSVDSVMETYVKPINDNPLVITFRVAGGSFLSNQMTGFELNGRQVYVMEELSSMSSMATGIVEIIQKGPAFDTYGEEEKAALDRIADSIGDSAILSTVAAEIVYGATEAWENGETYIGVSRDILYIDKSGTLDDFTDQLITVLNKDSAPGNEDALGEDLATVVDLVGVMIDEEVFAALAKEDALVETFASAEVITPMIVVLGENDSLKVLIPEVINIGVRAIGSTLGIPTDAEAAYENLLDTVAAGLVEAQGKTMGAEQDDFVKAMLNDALNDAGISVEQTVVADYAERMTDAFLRTGEYEATANGVRRFFSEYALDSSISLGDAESFGQVTVLITLDRLLTDAEEAAEKINAETLRKEAASLGLVFEAAGAFLNVNTEESIDMQVMADSVGEILNALKETVSFGKDKTALLFTALLQSDMLRDTIQMDLLTATDLAQKGTSGDPDYQQTFKAVVKAIEMMESVSANNGELTDETISELLKEINPQTAAMLESYITAERMQENYDVPAEYSEVCAPLISGVFSYMANADMSEEEYQQEATAINNLLTVTMGARDNAQNPTSNQSLFGENGVLGKGAEETVNDLMASGSLTHALNETEFEADPFGLSDMMANNQETDEMQAFENAIYNYYQENPTEENRETLGNLAKLFGADIDSILGK